MSFMHSNYKTKEDGQAVESNKVSLNPACKHRPIIVLESYVEEYFISSDRLQSHDKRLENFPGTVARLKVEFIDERSAPTVPQTATQRLILITDVQSIA